MKRFALSFLLLCTCFMAFSQQDTTPYNKALADSLGADKYGMKSYIFVILKTGSNNLTDKEKLNQLFRGHMENIGNLAKAGKLVVAGPFRPNDKTYRGLFIFNVKTIAEVKELLEKDPAVKEKIFDAEIFEWYGSAALPLYLPYHDKIQEKKP